jgi:alkylation response protein AidB-like acyl-CoA dehydrogenase
LREDAAFAHRLAELELKLFVLQSTCYRAVAESMQGAEQSASASIMKLRGSELRQDIAEAMVDAVGLAGIVFDPSSVVGDGMPAPTGYPESPGIVRDHFAQQGGNDLWRLQRDSAKHHR